MIKQAVQKEKSVSWLFKKKPPTETPEPNANSMLLVKATAFPYLSTILICVVDFF